VAVLALKPPAPGGQPTASSPSERTRIIRRPRQARTGKPYVAIDRTFPVGEPLAGALALVATAVQAQNAGTGGTGSNPSTHTVQGHMSSTGTYVAPYVATNPNSTQRDNFSAYGNVNPYTGAVGTRPPRY
jgi:hypothetical protein